MDILERDIVSFKEAQSKFGILSDEYLISNVPHGIGAKESIVPIDDTNRLGRKLGGIPKIVVSRDGLHGLILRNKHREYRVRMGKVKTF